MPEIATQMQARILSCFQLHIEIYLLRLQLLKGSLRVPNALNEPTLFRGIRVLRVHVMSGNGE